MKGIILINAYSKDQPWVRQAKRLRDEFEALGVTASIVKNDGFNAAVIGGRLDISYPECDFCVYLDKDKYVSRMLEASEMRLYNRHGAIRDCDDKFDTFIRLADSGIPMPDTLPSLLCYDPTGKISEEALGIIEKRIGYPAVVKTAYGSMGKGVYICRDREELEKTSNSLVSVPHLYQKFVSDSVGKDIRVIVIGGEAFAWMRRKNSEDFRSNAARGGTGEVCELMPEYKAVAEKCAAILGLDYCGVDLFETKDGPVLCEVNSNAFFEEAERVTKKNIARAYCEYIISDTEGKNT